MQQLPKNINWPLILFGLFFFGPLLGQLLIPLIIAGALFFGYKKLQTNSNFNKIINNLRKPRSSSKAGEVINHMAQNPIDPMLEGAKKKMSFIILLALGAWLFFSSIQIVEAGYTGVYSLFGKVKDKELKSGFHLVIPLARVIPMSTRTEEYTMSILQGEGRRQDSDAIAALTKEGLNVDLDMTVLYHLDEDSAAEIYEKVGLNYEEKIIRPEIRSAIREVIAQYEAKDIYSEKRQEAALKISSDLQAKLAPRGVIIEDVLLRNVKLPSGLAESIQQKLQAEQEAQRYDFLLQKEKKEKERKIIEAEGQKESQEIINQSLSTNYLYYLYVNQLKDREGTIYVPTSPTTGMPLFRNLGN